MSLDNTDELVPSRYALRVGEIDALVVSDGVLSLPGAMLGHNADPAVRTAWLNDMFLPPDVLEWALNAVVVRSGGRTVLIDAGIGVDRGLNLPRAGRLVQRLEAAGIDLASVTDVVLTHMQSSTPTGTTASNTTPRRRPESGSVFCGSWRQTASRWWHSPSFPSVCHVAVDGDVFRWAPGPWEY
jgi:hypothetical protein